MGELAGDKCIIRKRAPSCVSPGQCCRDRLRAFDTNPATRVDRLSSQIQTGQWGADQTVKKRAEEGKWGS